MLRVLNSGTGRWLCASRVAGSKGWNVKHRIRSIAQLSPPLDFEGPIYHRSKYLEMKVFKCWLLISKDFRFFLPEPGNSPALDDKRRLQPARPPRSDRRTAAADRNPLTRSRSGA